MDQWKRAKIAKRDISHVYTSKIRLSVTSMRIELHHGEMLRLEF